MLKPRILVTGATGKTGSVDELRRPFPSEPQFAPESKIWRREHASAHAERGASIAELRTLRA